MLEGKDKKRKSSHTCSASASVEVLTWVSLPVVLLSNRYNPQVHW